MAGQDPPYVIILTRLTGYGLRDHFYPPYGLRRAGFNPPPAFAQTSKHHLDPWRVM